MALEAFELGDEASGWAGALGAALEVVAAEDVGVAGVAERAVGHDQDRVRAPVATLPS